MEIRGTIVMLEGGHTTWIKGVTPEEVEKAFEAEPTKALVALFGSKRRLIKATAIVALIAD